jgi:zinc protease
MGCKNYRQRALKKAKRRRFIFNAAFRMFMGLFVGVQMCSASSLQADEAPVGTVASFTLDNGLQIVVIEDHRVPIVTHMVWYKVGSIDDPQGKSGLAHLLEHLMFKSFDAATTESFAQTMSRLGAIDNAVTRHDTTSYYQRVEKERLGALMAIEARRMGGLTLRETEVLVERDVVREERRSNIESDPVKLMSEQLSATLYDNHSYARSPIGWPHEIVTLTLDDAYTAYQRYYSPANAIVVIAGDVTPHEVDTLARGTYATIKSNGKAPVRLVTIEPEPIASRRLTLADPRVQQPALFRYYLAPSHTTARPMQAESLEVLTTVLGNGETSRLYRALVSEGGSALAVGARYIGDGRDSGQIVIFAIVQDTDALNAAETQLDIALAEMVASGIGEEELTRAKTAIETRLIIESDNQMTLATRYGQALAVGRTLEDAATFPHRITQVTKADVDAAARIFLVRKRSVTGNLVPAGQEGRVR